jgi:hypothetical protein
MNASVNGATAVQLIAVAEMAKMPVNSGHKINHTDAADEQADRADAEAGRDEYVVSGTADDTRPSAITCRRPLCRNA